MATDVLIAEAFPGDPLGGNSKKIWARKPGRGGRRGPGVIDALYDVHGVLDEFISRDTTVRRLPVLARWNEFRDHYHRRGELEALLEEVEQARTWTAASFEAGTEVALVLERLQALVRRALDEALVLAVIVD
ncbi:hypothetical protein ACUN7V_07300 [Quadrisphaera oryzae]|uniref:hypothetical protein n=1 Tax=Quadrisphaera TaxID=317661 RepID=UPI0016479763|nr:hypothetical protein [Quadrisphaera sp. RL12-1S]MBC3763596.1 hypothetical protein [Quadrisphaera sp. RL12-1S]